MTAKWEQICIVGVGLIGGSVGMAVKARGLANKVMGVGRNPKRLEKAFELGAIDEFTTELEQAAADSQLVILCWPVDLLVTRLGEVAEQVAPDTVVTDVGSVKQAIVEEAERRFPKGNFIGSHPLAGSDRTGVEFARADLFEQATCFVTPEKGKEAEPLAMVVSFWRELGSIPMIVSAEDHDFMVAATSHLPHLVSLSLVSAVQGLDYDKNLLRRLVGSGFRDTTRIAKGDAGIWAPIFELNRQALLEQVKRLEQSLTELRQLIAEGKHEELVQRIKALSDFRQHL